jgi:hypothetical protein
MFFTLAFILAFFVLPKGEASDRNFQPTVKAFYWLQAGFLNDETEKSNPTFQFRRARFGLKGMVQEKIGYHLMVEGIHDGIDPKVYQAWITCKLHPLANIRVGQFKYPFGIEAYPGFVWWKFYNPSFVSGGIVKEMGRKGADDPSGLFRDIGVEVAGTYIINDHYTATYKFIMMNGNGINKTDNNDFKDVILHGILKAPYGIELGASCYMGRYEDNVDIIDYDSVNYCEWAIGLDLTWKYKLLENDLRFQGELITADYETNGDDIKPWGYYIYGTYFVLPQVEAGIRYDFYEPDKNAAVTVEKKRVTLLAGYHFAEDQQININYEIIDDDASDRDNLLTVLFQITL